MLELLSLGLALLVGTTTPVQASTTPITIEVHRGNNAEALEYAIQYFKDEPEMLKISYCESSWRMWDDSGKKPRVLSGIVQPQDRGFMMVNEHFHKEEALALGYDIENFYGNIGYGKYLYEHNGTKDWNASKGCWGKMTDGELKVLIDGILNK